MLRLLDPSSPFHSQFQWVHIPVPNMLCQLFLMAGTWAVGPFWAAKVLVALYCLGAVWICGRAARRFAPRNPAPLFVLLLGIAAFNSCFWNGYMNFQIALLLLLLYVELTAENRPALRWSSASACCFLLPCLDVRGLCPDRPGARVAPTRPARDLRVSAAQCRSCLASTYRNGSTDSGQHPHALRRTDRTPGV